MLFNIFQGCQTPQYVINLNCLVDVDHGDFESTITLSNGREYTLEGDDLARFCDWLAKQPTI